jgi:HlyD family secretion protein
VKIPRVLLLALIAALGCGGYYRYAWRGNVGAAEKLPVATAKQGDFQVLIRSRGELKAMRSAQVTAPQNVPDLRIIYLAPSGTQVKEGDVIIRFDPSTAKQQLSEKEADLKRAQAGLDQMLAQSRLSIEQDRIDLNTASYQVERAKLEVSKQEIVSRIQGEESKIDLGVAEQKKSVQSAKVNLTTVSNEARLASLTRLRDKAKEDVEITKSRLERMELRAPISGMITYLRNTSQGWMNAKPFKVGDSVWPGAAVAEIPDLETIQLETKIEEIDRGRMKASQKVRIHIDSLPETNFEGEIDSISPMVSSGWDWPPSRNFLGYARFLQPDLRLRPGMNGRLDAFIETIPNAISVPAKAVFARGGKPVVYVKTNEQWLPLIVEVLARNPDEVAVKGLAANSEVAMLEPASSQKKAAK